VLELTRKFSLIRLKAQYLWKIFVIISTFQDIVYIDYLLTIHHCFIMILTFLINDQTFSTLKELIRSVNEHAELEDYTVVIFRIKKFKLRVRRKTWIKCDREEKSDESKERERRHFSSRLIEVINSQHNHAFSIVVAHSVLRKMTMIEKIKSEIAR
jgi:hypothetical protein